MIRQGLLALILLSGFVVAPLAVADSSEQAGKVIAGWVESITFPDKELVVKAKLDSGAKTSSIFGVNVESFEKDGDPWVRFDLYLEDIRDEAHRIQMERPLTRWVKIKNHDGNHDRRMVVELEFCFDGRRHTTEFTLADRNEFIYDVLLGREFLKGVAVIDPEETFLTLAACPEPEPEPDEAESEADSDDGKSGEDDSE